MGENLVSTLEPSFLIGSGNEDNYNSLDEFQFGQNSAADFGVSCPSAYEKKSYNLVSTLAPSFLIRSSSFLQVWRTTIVTRRSLKFGMIRTRTAELAALERLKKFP